jgi:hypothetical protein
MFEAHNSITTCTIIAPMQTRRLLSASEDPIYDLCNPPPVTLVSRAESVISSRAPNDAESALPTPTPDANFKKVAESPAYIARTAHRGGNIIVTADYTGAIKVFRQDCAFAKRVRLSETWDTGSLRRAGSKLGRPSSIISRSSRSRGDSISTQPPNDRIMSWRQGISHGSFDSQSSLSRRNPSPRKSLARLSLSSVRHPDSPSLRPMRTNDTLGSGLAGTPKTSISMDRTPEQSVTHSEDSTPPSIRGPERMHSDNRVEREVQNPMAVYNGQSWLFWSSANKNKNMPRGENSHENDRPMLDARTSGVSQLSRLTDELSDDAGAGAADEQIGDRERSGKERGREKEKGKREEDRNGYRKYYT